MSLAAERWSRLKSLFEAASDLSVAERASFVRALPPEDDELRDELLSLLAAHDEESQFVERAIGAEERNLARAADFEPAGRRIGVWEIVRPLGRGGMGEVYLVVRADDAFRKEAALKLIRPGLASPDTAARFRAERQVLAGLEHPSIARLLDGGTDGRGLPYLVMEYVDGEPIDVYCDHGGLDLRERLELFLTVCAAVAAAHRSLVVHRDLKPSNILVTAQGQVKLLDFGIAKILDGSLARDDVLETRAGRPLMTLAYASPEQIRGGAVTTATDVYGLGVLLYRLLTGRPPQRLDGASSDLERAICEEDPEPPSAAVMRGREQERDETSLDHAERLRLGRRLRGDLDVIVLTALSKEPSRRYGSAEALGEDVDRHLRGLPVRARPDSVAYRARKFASRHRTGVAAGGLVALSLVSGVAATLWQARIARRRARAAELAQAEAEQISGFLRRMLAAANSNWYVAGNRVGADMTVAQVLDEAATRMGEELDGQPQVEVSLRQTLARSYSALGLYQKAEEQARVALELERKAPSRSGRRLAQVLSEVAATRVFRGDYQEAEALYRRALDLYQRLSGERDQTLPADGANEPRAVTHQLGVLLWRRGRLDEAEALLRESVENYRDASQPQLAIALGNLGLIRDGRGDLEGAAALYQEALDTFAGLEGRELYERAWSLINLGQVRRVQGRYAEAETLLCESLEVWSHTVGADHPNAAQSYIHLAHNRCLAGDALAAEPAIERALEILCRSVSTDHPDIAKAETIQGLILLRSGRHAEAETALRHALSVHRTVYPAGDWRTASTAGVLGECLLEQGRIEAALPLAEEAYAGLAATLGEKHPRTAQARQLLARAGDPRQASATAGR